MQRRDFLKMMGVGAGAVGAGALGIKTTPKQPARQVTPEDAAAMDQHHREAVEVFLANIGADPNFWGLPLEYEMDGDVKVFNITCQDVEWFTTPTMSFPAMTYNGIVPGPYIRATEGETIRLNVTNEMVESTAIHFHGVYVPNNQDGVPYVTEEPIVSGATRTYEFTLRNPGTHMYHSHHNAAEQVTKGLMAAFIIDPADPSTEPEVTAEYIWVLNDSAMGFTINGKAFPYTQPIVAKLGDKIRVRYMNEGLMIHPMHLHGIPQQVIAKDGWPLPMPYKCDTLNVAPGERYDVIIDCTELGFWAYHCHVLTHAESRDGMFGMVTVLVVQE